MDLLTVLLRLTHVLAGVVWVGMMVMNVFFLMPAIRDAGPAGGQVMAALQRRKLMTAVPILALFTIVSGIWLMQRVWGGMRGLMASRPGQTYATGAVLALVAFVIGITIMRPAMVRAGELAQSMGSAKSDEERAALGAELAGFRNRGATVGRLVAALLILATAAMGVARYL